MFLNSEKEILLNQNFLKLAVFAEYMIFFFPERKIFREENTKQGGKQHCFSTAPIIFSGGGWGLMHSKELCENQSNAQAAPPRLKLFLFYSRKKRRLMSLV